MSTPDYKALYEQAVYHLRVVSGSRNSFSPEFMEWLLAQKDRPSPMRTREVEQMHREAYLFLKEHDE